MTKCRPYTATYAFKRLFDTLGLGALVLMIMLLMSEKVGTMWGAHPRPVIEPTVHLEVTSLDFFGGLFYQLVQPLPPATARQADWTASIWRNDTFVCGGSGRGNYTRRDRPARFTPNQWTGDDCGPLTYGAHYEGIASWEYTGNDGVLYTLSAKINFTYTRPTQ